MKSSAAAIAWEIWSRNRWFLSAVVAAIPLSFLGWVTIGAWWPETIKIFELFAIQLSIGVLFWAFSFTEQDSRGRHSGFPARMFVLPVRTRTLVSYPMLYGVVSVL